MKIVNRTEFLKMKPGTLYSSYKPCIFGDIEIKGDSLENDWYYQQINDAIDCNDSGEFAEKLFASEKDGSSIDMDFHCEGRNGMYDGEEFMFAVWEKKDVVALIERLRKTFDSED